MTLKAVLETLDNVEESLQPLYSEADGKFVLQIDGVQNHPDTLSLVNAYDRVKQDNASLKEKVNGLESASGSIPPDFDLDVWNKAKSGKADEAAIEAARSEVRKAMQDEIDTANKNFNSLQSQVRQTSAESEITKALTKVGVKPALIDGAMGVFQRDMKFNEDNSAVIETPLGPMPIAEFAERWAKDEGNRDYIAQPQGADVKSSTGGNGQKPINRSKMTPEQKHQFITENGQKAYLSLEK